MASKDLITCHVLDTLTGHPAVGVYVTLQFDSTPLGTFEHRLLQPKHTYTFKGITNADGRIANWHGPLTLQMISDALEHITRSEKLTAWALTFDTGAYYGEGHTFWPEVRIKFFVRPGEHYHVPLLLGPHSYTTYRGS